jgi:hypothetical protein
MEGCSGKPLIPKSVLHSASWLQLELHVLVTVGEGYTLGLIDDNILENNTKDRIVETTSEDVHNDKTYETKINQTKWFTKFTPLRFSVIVSRFEKYYSYIYGGSLWVVVTRRCGADVGIFLARDNRFELTSRFQYKDTRELVRVAVRICILGKNGKSSFSYRGTDLTVKYGYCYANERKFEILRMPRDVLPVPLTVTLMLQ